MSGAGLVSAFPTAPGWFRPLLRLERTLLRLLKRRQRDRAERDGLADRAGGTRNLRYNPEIGILIGERTIPGEVNPASMAAHAGRYLWAMGVVGGRRVVDLGCGVGYGSYLLSWAADEVVAVDVDESALAYGREHFPAVEFQRADLNDANDLPSGDIAVCFEVLEHLQRPENLLAAAVARYPRLLLSFPNPLLGGSHINPHHVQDWPLVTLKSKLREAGAGRIKAWHQARNDAAVRRRGLPWSETWILEVERAGAETKRD